MDFFKLNTNNNNNDKELFLITKQKIHSQNKKKFNTNLLDSQWETSSLFLA